MGGFPPAAAYKKAVDAIWAEFKAEESKETLKEEKATEAEIKAVMRAFGMKM
ncbi:MAG: hypothetical protein IJ202_02705 [Bacteroidales bacterium]|nr:hypothetical protein [Bacteroidales bacterium]